MLVPIERALFAEALQAAAHYGLSVEEWFARAAQEKLAAEPIRPPADSTDVAAVIRGVIEAEQGAIDHYMKVIQACEGVDYVTADMVTTILADEEGHLREFEGFLKEYEKK